MAEIIPDVKLKRITAQKAGLLSTALPSPLGDAVGLLADGMGYVQDPKSLTPTAGLLSLAGVIPGVPALSQWTRGEGAADWLLHIADKANVKSIRKKGLLPGKDDYVYLWNGGLDGEAAQIMNEARQTRLGLDWQNAGLVKNGYFAVNRKALGNRIEVDPYTGESRVRGAIPPDALRFLESE